MRKRTNPRIVEPFTFDGTKAVIKQTMWQKRQEELNRLIATREEERRAKQEMHAKILEARKSGASLREIGAIFGVTGERIRQILKRL